MARPTASHASARHRRLAALGLGLAVALAALGIGTAHASLVRALALEELTRKADVIVLGVATEEQARRGVDKKTILTDVSVRVDQTLKGDAKRGGEIVVTELGGELDGVAMQVPGEAGLAVGQRALLFLYRAPKSHDLRFVGMSQGLMPLTQQGTTTLVQPGGSGAALVEAGSDGQLHDAPAALMTPQPLGDLLDRITKLVATQK